MCRHDFSCFFVFVCVCVCLCVCVCARVHVRACACVRSFSARSFSFQLCCGCRCGTRAAGGSTTWVWGSHTAWPRNREVWYRGKRLRTWVWFSTRSRFMTGAHTDRDFVTWIQDNSKVKKMCLLKAATRNFHFVLILAAPVDKSGSVLPE